MRIDFHCDDYDCNPGCDCRPGYYRNSKNRCVPATQCGKSNGTGLICIILYEFISDFFVINQTWHRV